MSYVRVRLFKQIYFKLFKILLKHYFYIFWATNPSSFNPSSKKQLEVFNLCGIMSCYTFYAEDIPDSLL